MSPIQNIKAKIEKTNKQTTNKKNPMILQTAATWLV